MGRLLKKTILEISIGIILYELILSVVFIIFSDMIGYTRSSLLAGTAVGTVMCFAVLIDMGLTAEDAVASTNENYARNKTIIHMFARRIIIIAAAVIFWKSSYVNIAAMISALLGLKPGVYMQPFFSNMLKKKYNKN